MNEALEDCKDRYVLSDLRINRFKDTMWEVNHGVSGCRVTDMVFEVPFLSSKWGSIECNTIGE